MVWLPADGYSSAATGPVKWKCKKLQSDWQITRHMVQVIYLNSLLDMF